MSGGMRQRVMIAIALSCNPEILIADEPTTALDVTIQAKILDLLKEVRDSRKMAMLLITHNLGLVAEMCDRVIVMYRGRIVEAKPVHDLFARPEHPYTRSLLGSIPRLDSPPKQPLPRLEWDPRRRGPGGGRQRRRVRFSPRDRMRRRVRPPRTDARRRLCRPAAGGRTPRRPRSGASRPARRADETASPRRSPAATAGR
jgi:ABC-type dipeptide/oligopeptide/nickel transport system ATPase component